MSRFFVEEHRLGKVIRYVRQVLSVEDKNTKFLNQLRESEITHQLVIRRLNAIIMVQAESGARGYIDELLSQNILEKFYFFFQNATKNHQDLRNRLSPEALEEMLELVKLYLQVQTTDQQIINNLDIKCTKYILNSSFSYIESLNDEYLWELLIGCLFSLRKKRREIVNDQFLTSLFLKTPGKHQQFLDFFEEYFDRVNSENFMITSQLFACFIDKLPGIIENEQEVSTFRLLEAYSSIVRFLQRQPKDSEWFFILLSKEYSGLFEGLKDTICKKTCFYDQAMIINDLLKCYTGSTLKSNNKNEFILSFYKYIIQKAPSFLTYIETLFLSNESYFLEWFFVDELRSEKEVAEIYMSNKSALELLTVMLIYFHCNFTNRTQEISNKVRKMNLLDEAKLFLDYEPLYQSLQILYENLGQTPTFQELVNRVKDQQDGLFR